MKQYIDKDAVVTEIEKRISSLESIGSENYLHDNSKEQYAMLVTLKSLKFSINSLETKEVDSIWHDARKTIPEDSSNQIICIKEDDLAVATVGKLVHGTKKWAYLHDLLNISNVQAKEVDLRKIMNKQVELIKAEIEKRLDTLYDELPDGNKVIYVGVTASEANITGKYTALESLLDYINSLDMQERTKELLKILE